MSDTHENDLSHQLKTIADRLASVEKKIDGLIEARDAQPRDYRPQSYGREGGYGGGPRGPRPYGNPQFNNYGRTRTARYEGSGGPQGRPNYPPRGGHQGGYNPQRGNYQQGGRPNKFQNRGNRHQQ